MPTVKCDNCGHSVEVEDATKKYRLPLFFIFLGIVILTYEHTVNNPSDHNDSGRSVGNCWSYLAGCGKDSF